MYLSDRLSRREKHVYDNLLRGRNATEIAQDGLIVEGEIEHISYKTARAHLTSIYKKCGVKNAVELLSKHLMEHIDGLQ